MKRNKSLRETRVYEVDGNSPVFYRNYGGCSLIAKPLPVKEEDMGSDPMNHPKLVTSSSVVEQHAVNVPVVGSIPTLSANLRLSSHVWIVSRL